MLCVCVINSLEIACLIIKKYNELKSTLPSVYLCVYGTPVSSHFSLNIKVRLIHDIEIYRYPLISNISSQKCLQIKRN